MLFYFHGGDLGLWEHLILIFVFIFIPVAIVSLFLLFLDMFLKTRQNQKSKEKEKEFMSETSEKHPLNVKGKYYVDCETCLDHECCVDIAPNYFKMDEDSRCAYIFKQPETPEEEAQCHEAFMICPVEAIHNNGDL